MYTRIGSWSPRSKLAPLASASGLEWTLGLVGPVGRCSLIQAMRLWAAVLFGGRVNRVLDSVGERDEGT